MCSLLVGFLPVSFIFTFSVKSVGFLESYILASGQSVFFGCRYIRQGLMHGLKDSNGFLYLWNIVLILTMLQMMHTLRPLLGPQKAGLSSTQTRNSFFCTGKCLSEVGTEEKLSAPTGNSVHEVTADYGSHVPF